MLRQRQVPATPPGPVGALRRGPWIRERFAADLHRRPALHRSGVGQRRSGPRGIPLQERGAVLRRFYSSTWPLPRISHLASMFGRFLHTIVIEFHCPCLLYFYLTIRQDLWYNLFRFHYLFTKNSLRKTLDVCECKFIISPLQS